MENTVRRLVRDELRFRKKLAVLEYARACGNDAKAWREFKVPKSTFYLWKKAYVRAGRAGLKRKKPGVLLTPNGFPHKLLRKFFRSGAPINWVLSASCGTRSAIMESVYHNQVYTLSWLARAFIACWKQLHGGPSTQDITLKRFPGIIFRSM